MATAPVPIPQPELVPKPAAVHAKLNKKPHKAGIFIFGVLFAIGIVYALAHLISDISTVLGYDAFHPGTNFHDPNDPENQNGVVFFPGSSPVYAGSILVGGFGVSGDGVDQDDVVAFYGVKGFAAPLNIQADQYFVRGIRLPYQEFSRNPFQL